MVERYMAKQDSLNTRGSQLVCIGELDEMRFFAECTGAIASPVQAEIV